MNRRLYAIHRWLSALAVVQLAAWVASGFFFATVPEARVKGSPVAGAHAAPITDERAIVGIDIVLRKLSPIGAVERMELVGTPDGPMYRGRVGDRRFRIDARTGEERPVDETEARATASRDQPSSPRALGATRIEQSGGIEYRGKPLPAWRVPLDDGKGTVVYVDALTGEVTARRNDVWRAYDLLWSLHIMDYRERESFRHPLLSCAALLGLLTVLSGGALWIVRAVRWARGRVARTKK